MPWSGCAALARPKAATRGRSSRLALSRAKAFAEKQGLNADSEEVAKAIAELDYETLANLSMQMAEIAVAETEKQEEETKPADEVPAWYQMASYVDMKIEDNGEYGDMLQPVSK